MFQVKTIEMGLSDIMSNSCLNFTDGSPLADGDPEPEGDYIYVDTNTTTGCFYLGGGYDGGKGRHYIHLEVPGCMVSDGYSNGLSSMSFGTGDSFLCSNIWVVRGCKFEIYFAEH